MRLSSVDQIILGELESESSHLTSHQIFTLVKKKLPAVNPSTVYRSLERLVSQGTVSVSDIGIGSSVYEMVTEDQHHHLVCQSCGKVEVLISEDVTPLFNKLETKYGYSILTRHLILFGICKTCQRSNNKQH